MTSTPARPLAAAVATAALLLGPACAAHAEPGYRYWGYSQLEGDAWVASPKGAGQVVPAEGSVEGWRYQTSAKDTRAPRDVVTFDEVCGGTPAEAGRKRVAVVVDYGRDADHAEDAGEAPAPSAECAVVDEKADGAEVLAAVAQVQDDKGMVCAIDAFPADCSDSAVEAVSAEALAADDRVDIRPATAAGAGADEADQGGDRARWLGLGGATLLLTGLLGWLLGRSRRGPGHDLHEQR